MNKITLVYGLPSSGKSTLARRMKEETELNYLSATILETDDYFKQTGQFLWDYRRLSDAHEWTYDQCAQAIRDNVNLIIVANVNLNFRHIAPYVYVSQVFKYELELIEPDTPWRYDLEKLFELSKLTHNVRMENYISMNELRTPFEELKQQIKEAREAKYEW